MGKSWEHVNVIEKSKEHHRRKYEKVAGKWLEDVWKLIMGTSCGSFREIIGKSGNIIGKSLIFGFSRGEIYLGESMKGT